VVIGLPFVASSGLSLWNCGLYVMGVFEQQHCNYEHLFGQALSPDFMCTGQSPIWQGRNTPGFS
jgi:hypothetical protein